MNELIFHFIVSLLATAAFGIVFYAPLKTIPFSAITGACGYMAFYIISQSLGLSEILGCAVGGTVIAFMAEIFAIIQKNPVTAYEMPAIMPLVPGIGLYRTMLAFLEGTPTVAMDYLFQTVLSAGSIAIGLILTEAATQVWLHKKYSGSKKQVNQ